MSSSHRVWFRSCLLFCLAAIGSCGPSHSPPAPDAPPSMIPTSPAGTFAVTSRFDVEVPAPAAPVIRMLTAATDGADDPARYLLDRIIATLPDGPIKTVAGVTAPYVAAYLNARLVEIAPRFVAGIDAMAAGLARIATHLGTVETLRIDASGAAVRTITGARFELGAAPIAVSFADGGLPDIAVHLRVAIAATGRVSLSEHMYRLPYGALLHLG